MMQVHPRAALAAMAGAIAAGLTALAPLPLAAADEPWFRDTRNEGGPDFRHRTGAKPERPYFPEIAGGGGALVDVDGDGDLDAYLVQSGSLYEPDGDVGRNRLYLNDGAGRFTDATDGSGADDRGYGMGVATGDYDGDGDTDLYVTNVRANALLRNDGGGRFTDVTAEAAVGDTSWSTSAAFADLDLDGDLDLYVANYVNWTMATELDCPHPTGNLDYCDPTHYNAPSRDTLYRNDGNGRFTDVSESAGMGGTYGNGLGVMCADVTGDGLPDVMVANDRVFDNLWVNHGDLTFTEDALFRGCACDDDGYPKAGMGMTIIDYDDDGDRDFMVVNYAKETDSFYENDGNGFFIDRAAAIGVGFATKQYTRFGVGFGDFDNDGRTDIYYANGRATRPRADYRLHGDPFAEPNLLFRGIPGGKVEEVLPRGGIAPPEEFTSRAAVFGDVDNDGGLDVLVVNRDGPVQMLRNVRKDRGNWIGFRVRQAAGGDALGATVFVTVDGRTVQRDVLSAQSYLAASDPRPLFGLGKAKGVTAVKVHWPGGPVEEFGGFPAGAYHDLVRGTGRGS